MQLHRVSYLFAPIAVVVLFGSVLTGEDRLAFRDVSHFYTPLYEYVAHRTSDQWLPLWNPLDQTGLPLLGETTTAVLYPVRWAVFALPMPAAQAMGWYIVLHLILASTTATLAARSAGVSVQIAPVAGITYTLSGCVFFLYTNPPFLVGAAWLPIVFATLVAGEAMSRRARIVLAALALAMMILGGDPQTALHAMLVATAVLIVCSIRSLLGKNALSGYRPADACIVMTASVLLAAMLTAPQLAASISWSRQSGRVLATERGNWTEPPALGSKRHDAYQFSLPPWHAAEVISPNAWGTMFPVNRRVSQLIPGDGRMWTPTIYTGALAALALLTCLVRVRRDGVDTWAMIAFAGLILSFGHFGFAWIVQQIPGMLNGVDSAIGGPYWCLHHWLPKYDSFRYPTKWLPVFALAASVVAARCADEIAQSSVRFRGSRFTFSIVLIIAGIGIAAVSILIASPQLLNGLAERSDEYWGPIDLTGGLRQIRWSLVHTFCAASGVAFVLKVMQTRRTSQAIGCCLLAVIVCLEMGFAARGTIAKLDVRDEAAVLAEANYQIDSTNSYWMRFGDVADASWRKSHSSDRILQVGTAERIAGFGRWHLERKRRTFNSMTSIRSRHVDDFWRVMEQRTNDSSSAQRDWMAVQDWLGITKTTQNPVNYRTVASWRLADNKSVSMNDVIDGVIEKRGTRPVVFHADANATDIPAWRDAGARRTFQIRLNQESLFYEPVYQDGNWFAGLTNTDTKEHEWVPVHQVDFIKQGVIVPKGNWQIDFYYAPRWVTPSITVAIGGLFVWLLLTLLTTLSLRSVPDSTASASSSIRRAR